MEISLVKKEDLKSVCNLYGVLTKDLRNEGIHQWDRFYPNRFVIKNDIKQGNLFGIVEEGQVIGAIVLDSNESKKYKILHWHDNKGKPLVIHRLGIHPDCQGKGYGKLLLQFAEEYAQENGHTSIRLDVFSGNPGALTIYERKGYKKVGTIKFPMRPLPYYCYEKVFTK
jgi:ribosomal protein S18 acetylase RimI-like enzyme